MTPETPQTPPAPQCCRMTQIVLLVSLLMLGAGVGLMLWNEVRQKTAEVALGNKVVGEYHVNNEPKIKWFIASLQAFGKTNPDFNTILAKYNLIGAPSAAPAVAAPAVPKK